MYTVKDFAIEQMYEKTVSPITLRIQDKLIPLGTSPIATQHTPLSIREQQQLKSLNVLNSSLKDDLINKVYPVGSTTSAPKIPGMKNMGLAGAALGLGYSMFDGSSDNLLSAGLKVGTGASIGVAAHFVADYFNDVYGDKGVKASTAANSVDKKNADKIAKELGKNPKLMEAKLKSQTQRKFDAEGAKKQAKRARSKLGIAATVGLSAFGLASVMDTSKRLEADKRASRMVGEQERNLQKKQASERRALRQAGYDHINMGEIAFQMFEERTGHHLMGNAKFN